MIRICISSLLLVFASSLVPAFSEAQHLAEYYRALWFRDAAQRTVEARGLRVEPFPPDHLVSASDSIRWQHEWQHRLDRSHIRVPLVDIRSWRSIRRLERPVFDQTFLALSRSYIGNDRRTSLDTTLTLDLRARLEHAYGAPTRTLPDMHENGRLLTEDYVQFEYWLLANDSIPVVVMDAHGPFDRGIVLATDAKYRNLLPDIKRAFAREMFKMSGRRYFADYYFNEPEDAWYVAGYDGERFIVKRIARPNLSLGRPWIGLLR